MQKSLKRFRSVSLAKERIQEELCPHLLFLHAWTGCDTTSAVYDIEKVSFVKRFLKSKHLQELAETMSDVWATREEIEAAGSQIFIILHGGEDTLNRLR